MKEVLEIMIACLVDNRDQVNIEEVVNDRTIDYKVKVAPEDMGKVIGKQGRVAKSISSFTYWL